MSCQKEKGKIRSTDISAPGTKYFCSEIRPEGKLGRQMLASPVRCQGETWLNGKVHGAAQTLRGDTWGGHMNHP